MLTKPVKTGANTASRAGCVRRKLGRNTPSSRPGSLAAEHDPRSSILQQYTERLTATKISVIEQLAYKNTAYVIILQETNCTAAINLVIPSFSPVGSVLNRTHGLAMFVHEQLECTLVD